MAEHVQSVEPLSAFANQPQRGVPETAALTRRMIAGDEMAWRDFYDAYFDRLWRYLLVVAAGHEDVARDALQSALIRVARHVRVFHDATVFWNWLTRVARSAFLDETRKRRRYSSFLDRFTGHLGPVTEGAPFNPEERLETLLDRELALLPADEHKLIEQKYFARRAVREIAGELHLTEKAVESKSSRVRRKLKQAVLGRLKDESD